jgi:hypothetical protein
LGKNASAKYLGGITYLQFFQLRHGDIHAEGRGTVNVFFGVDRQHTTLDFRFDVGKQVLIRLDHHLKGAWPQFDLEGITDLDGVEFNEHALIADDAALTYAWTCTGTDDTDQSNEDYVIWDGSHNQRDTFE